MPPSSRPTRGQQIQADKSVRCWSEVGVTIPIEDTYGNIKVLFGHERIAKSSSQEEISRTMTLIDEFNEAEIERRVKKYRKLFAEINGAVSETTGSVQDRARKKLGSKKRKAT